MHYQAFDILLVMKSETSNRGVRAREELRNRILDGEWPPGTRLQPAALAAETGWSTTIVRESLTHLAGEGLLAVRPNRGFFVTDLSFDELKWITELRCRTEDIAITLAVERGDIAWESQLIAIHHQLERTPTHGPGEAGLSLEWQNAHRAFHAALLSACEVDKLCEVASSLRDSTMLYRRWSAPTESRRDVGAEHREILAAVLDRDAPRASRLLREHYEATLAQMRDAAVTQHATRHGEA